MTSQSVARRIVAAGGSLAVQTDGRPLEVPGGQCRAIVAVRAGLGRCRRRAWFALDAPDGLVHPFCGTHLQRLAAKGGLIVS